MQFLKDSVQTVVVYRNALFGDRIETKIRNCHKYIQTKSMNQKMEIISKQSRQHTYTIGAYAKSQYNYYTYIHSIVIVSIRIFGANVSKENNFWGNFKNK